MKDHHKYFGISIIAVLVVAAGLFYYQYYEYNKLESLMKSSILDMNSKIDMGLSQMDSKLMLETGNIKNTITALNDETSKKINEVTKGLTEVEQKTQQQLSAVKEDLQAEITGLETNIQGDFREIIKEAKKATVSVITNIGRGSGVIIGSNGKTVTNAHVIAGAAQIAIKTSDNKMYLVEIEGVDNTADIAVLMPIGTNTTFEVLKYANSDNIEVGEKVIALGNPFGLDFTATQGIVSATNRVAQNGLSYIQTDVPINPGNSGGPLINDEGRLIGINNFKVGGGEGLGFAIPSNTIEEAVERIS